jgi:hypothetical protein
MSNLETVSATSSAMFNLFCFVDSFRESVVEEPKDKIEAVLLGVWQTRTIGRRTEK